MRALALLRLSLTVGNLDRMTALYTEALGFAAVGPPQEAEPAMAALLGAERLRIAPMRRGAQILELDVFDPPGAVYPAGSRSNDGWFQHAALVTDDIAAAYARLTGMGFTPISRNGPQMLPGGISAYKFRDDEGHPLELIQLEHPMATAGGIDHSAIAVGDVGRSIGFYTTTLGLSVASRQVNSGPAQDALDGLDGTSVDVVALSPEQPAPHVELLGYRSPLGRTGPGLRPADIAASRLVLQVDSLAGQPGAVVLQDGSRAAVVHDPDGHALLLLDAAQEPTPGAPRYAPPRATHLR